MISGSPSIFAAMDNSHRPSPSPPKTKKRMTSPYCRAHAPAAAAAWSSSRPSRAVASPSTAPHPPRTRSGSTPHDVVTIHQRLYWKASSSLVCNQQRRRSRCCPRFEAARRINLAASHAARRRPLASSPHTRNNQLIRPCRTTILNSQAAAKSP